MARAQERVEQLAEERREAKQNEELLNKMQAAEIEKKQTQIANNVQAFGSVKEERD